MSLFLYTPRKSSPFAARQRLLKQNRSPSVAFLYTPGPGHTVMFSKDVDMLQNGTTVAYVLQLLPMLDQVAA